MPNNTRPISRDVALKALKDAETTKRDMSIFVNDTVALEGGKRKANIRDVKFALRRKFGAGAALVAEQKHRYIPYDGLISENEAIKMYVTAEDADRIDHVQDPREEKVRERLSKIKIPDPTEMIDPKKLQSSLNKTYGEKISKLVL